MKRWVLPGYLLYLVLAAGVAVAGDPAYARLADEVDDRTALEKVRDLRNENLQVMEEENRRMEEERRARQLEQAREGQDDKDSEDKSENQVLEFSEVAPIVDSEFTYEMVRKGTTFDEDPIERVTWDGGDLEIHVLTEAPCGVKAMVGVARLHENRVELTVTPQLRPGTRTSCVGIYRGHFVLHGLQRKSYRLGYRSGSFEKEVPVEYTF